MILGYSKSQLRRFAMGYVVKYDPVFACSQSDVKDEHVEEILADQQFIVILTDEIERYRHKNAIVEWLSEGKTLRDYCRQDGCPGFSAVYDWLEIDKDFEQRFARARDIGYDSIAQECLEISDTMINEIIHEESERGVKITRRDAIKHRNLQVDTRLKLLAKWNPKKYGNVQSVELSGKDGGAIETKDTTPLNEKELARRLAFILQKGAKSNESS